MEINNLEITELEELRNSIDNRIEKIKQENDDEIKRRNSIKNKTKLSQLTNIDTIFVINIFKSVISGEMVIRTGFKNIGHCYKNEDSKGFNLMFGGTSTWISNEESEKHYLLFNGFGIHNFSFCTLKPESWNKDLEDAIVFKIKQKKNKFEMELNSYKESLTKFDELTIDINNLLKNQITLF